MIHKGCIKRLIRYVWLHVERKYSTQVPGTHSSQLTQAGVTF